MQDPNFTCTQLKYGQTALWISNIVTGMVDGRQVGKLIREHTHKGRQEGVCKQIMAFIGPVITLMVMTGFSESIIYGCEKLCVILYHKPTPIFTMSKMFNSSGARLFHTVAQKKSLIFIASESALCCIK